MSGQKVVIGLLALCLGTTFYVALSMPRSADHPTSDTAADSRPGDREATRVIEELRSEIRQLGERLDQRLALIEQSTMASESVGVSDSLQQEANGNGGSSNSVGQSASTEELTVTLADKVADSVQTQLDAKLERMESRQRNRSVAGEWKAPIAELADELKLSEAQLGTATELFDQARDGVFGLLKTTRQDGGSLLDDLTAGLRDGKPDALTGFFQRVYTERVPGGERTYLAEMVSLAEQVRSDLSPHLSTEQMERLSSLKVAVLEVETGYDPVGDYIKTALQQ